MSMQVQVLLEAEKESSKIIQKAKQYRILKLKEARQEAEKEIEELKKQKMVEFKSYEEKVCFFCCCMAGLLSI
jgi:V-type H+-transporting ATPase subunit G